MPRSLLPEWITQNALLTLLFTRVLGIVIVLVGAALLLRLARVLTRRLAERVRRRAASGDAATARALEAHQQRIETVVRVGYSLISVLVWGFAITTCVAQVGVSVQPLVAGAGLIGAGIAFGSQAIVKDYVCGFFVVLEDQYDIGDAVTFSAGFSGIVERMTLRVTTLRAVDGSEHIVPNGTIGVVTNRTRTLGSAAVMVHVSVSADSSKVRAALEAAAKRVVGRENASELISGEVSVAGPLSVKNAAVEWSLSTRAQPKETESVKSWLLEAAIDELQKAEVPFPAVV